MKFTRQMALDVIEDELQRPLDEFHPDMATGLCGAFYMCEIISEKEWEDFLLRISIKVMLYRQGSIGISYH